MRMRTFIAGSAFILIMNGIVFADVCRYTDSAGRVHVVNDTSEVPEQYRSQVTEASALPAVNRMGRPGSSPSTRFLSDGNADQQESNGTKPAGDAAVELYVTSWCGYCRKLEKFLDDKGVKYTSYDIEKNSAAKRVYKELGGGGVPVSRIGTVIVRGYNPEAVMRAVRAR